MMLAFSIVARFWPFCCSHSKPRRADQHWALLMWLLDQDFQFQSLALTANMDAFVVVDLCSSAGHWTTFYLAPRVFVPSSWKGWCYSCASWSQLVSAAVLPAPWPALHSGLPNSTTCTGDVSQHYRVHWPRSLDGMRFLPRLHSYHRPQPGEVHVMVVALLSLHSSWVHTW